MATEPDQFCLRWNNFQVNISSALDNLKTEEDLVDVTLTCDGQNVKAHKVILSACSPYFRNVFKENPCQHPIVILKNVSYADVTALLSFMYQGEVYIPQDQLSSFLHTAELLQVKGLAGAADPFKESKLKAGSREAPAPKVGFPGTSSTQNLRPAAVPSPVEPEFPPSYPTPLPDCPSPRSPGYSRPSPPTSPQLVKKRRTLRHSVQEDSPGEQPGLAIKSEPREEESREGEPFQGEEDTQCHSDSICLDDDGPPEESSGTSLLLQSLSRLPQRYEETSSSNRSHDDADGYDVHMKATWMSDSLNPLHPDCLNESLKMTHWGETVNEEGRSLVGYVDSTERRWNPVLYQQRKHVWRSRQPTQCPYCHKTISMAHNLKSHMQICARRNV